MSNTNNEFSELVCIADTRERMQSRINRMEKFITLKGGLFDRSKLDLCDYHIEGYFREKSVNIGIEYKTFIDYNSSKEDLNSKLFRSGKLYDTVALFIEENGLSLAHSERGTFVKIMQVPDERANITNYHGYKNHLDSLAFDGVHVRTFQHEAFFVEDVYSLLLHLSKECHKGLHITGADYNTQFSNALCKLDGMGPATTHKILGVIPNLNKLVEYAHFDGLFEKMIGPMNGKKLRAFILNGTNIHECHTNYLNKFSQVPKSQFSGKEVNPSPPANNTSPSPGTTNPDDMGGATFLNSQTPCTPQKPSPTVAEVDPPSSVTALENNIFNYCSERKPFMNIMSTFTFQGIKSIEIHRAINNLEVRLKLSKTVEHGDTVYYQK